MCDENVAICCVSPLCGWFVWAYNLCLNGGVGVLCGETASWIMYNYNWGGHIWALYCVSHWSLL